MKKSIIALIILSIFCFASVVSAANPFSDVPANHWAYGAVNKLVKAGIIDGNGGAFKGEQTLTRYEVAQMVAKAIAKEEKADAENRALIEKLAKEFASELNTLGVRVAELEKNQGNQGPLKIDGWFRYAYENAAVSTSAATYFTNNSLSSDKVRNRDEIWLNIANKFDGTTRFEGSIQTETASDK
ncbi:MAG: S-layer y domain protein [Firmicutes bacterium]|nr:S-layer y domain protein [Bacillota bacterium]